MRVVYPPALFLFVSACEPDVGIPDDWATRPIPEATLEVVSDTCDGNRPYEWLGQGVFIENPSPISGDPLFTLAFDDSIRHRCVATEGEEGYSFECDQDRDRPIKIWVNQDERDCPGYAGVNVSGAFLGPRSAEVSLTYDVNDCPCETSCTPFPAPCVTEYRMTYADP